MSYQRCIPGLDNWITRDDQRYDRDADGGECPHCDRPTRLVPRTAYCGTFALKHDYLICDWCGWRDPDPDSEEDAEVDGEGE